MAEAVQALLVSAGVLGGWGGVAGGCLWLQVTGTQFMEREGCGHSLCHTTSHPGPGIPGTDELAALPSTPKPGSFPLSPPATSPC